MNKFSLQTKIILIALGLVIIPIIAANVIFFSHKIVFDDRGLITAISNAKGIETDRETAKEYTLENRNAIAKELKKFEKMSLDEFRKYIEQNGISESGSNTDEEDGEDEEDEEDEDTAPKKEKVTNKVEESSPQTGEKLSDEEVATLKEKKIEELKETLSRYDIAISLKGQEAQDLDNFIKKNGNELKSLDEAIRSLDSYQATFLYGSFIYVFFAIAFLVFYITNGTTPFKSIMEKLKGFRNDKAEAPQDLLECAFQFDSFMATARSLLQESRSIALEIGRKLEPLTVMTVFSDDNVKQFFTDVQEISRSSNYIANTLDSTTAHIQEVSASAQTIADRSHEAATDSAETAAIAGEGKNAVSETIDTMESIKDEVLGLEDVIENLNSASMQIGEIVNTITNIAYQTNLLALNAAIEAARAGEHGQGFTVVAGEVRKLAEESGEAAEDISKKIKEMLKKTGKAVESINRGATKVIEGVNIANLAGNNLDKIVSSVSNVNKMIQDISNASTEQSQNIDSLRGSIESITGATKITSEGTKRVASAVNEQLAHIKEYISVTKELLTLVQMMSDMLDKFNLN